MRSFRYSAKRPVKGLVCIWLTVLCVHLYAAPPDLTVERTDTVPDIDGNLDDPAWNDADTAAPFRTSDGAPARAQTRAYAAYDRRHLYVAFQCLDPIPGGIKADAKTMQAIWHDDAVAVFLQPNPDKALYFQYATNPEGVQFDQKVDGGLLHYGLDKEWQTATARTKTGWTVEMQIPFKSLGLEEHIGRDWAVNFCRSRAADKEASCWAPVESWHDFKHYGTVKGLFLFRTGAVDPGLRVESVDIGDVSSAGKPTVTVGMRNLKPDPLNANITVKCVSPTRKENTFSQATDIPARTSITSVVPFRITGEDGSHTLSYVVKDRHTGKTLVRSPEGVFRNRNEADVFLTRDVYTTEKTAEVVFRLQQDPAEVTLQLKKGSEVVIEKTLPNPGAQGRIPLDIAALAGGDYPLGLRFSDADKQPFAIAALELKKVAPLTEGTEVKVDRENRTLLVDGTPFFPLGMIMCTRLDEIDVETLNLCGFNTLIHWTQRYHANKDEDYYLTSRDTIYGWADKYGLYVIDWIMHYGFLYGYADVENTRDQFEPWINEIMPPIIRDTMHHPRLLARMTFDEPNLAAKYNEGGYDILEYSRIAYDRLREIDPYHPVWVNFSGRIPPGEPWSRTYDMASIDPYWRPFYGEKVDYVAKNTARADAVARAFRKTLTIVPCAETFGGSGRGLTPAEQRCQSYLAIIAGTKGLFYYLYPLRNKAMLDAFSKLTREITQLAPTLLSPTPPQRISSLPAGRPCPIAAVIKRHNRRTTLITANFTDRPVDAVLKVHGAEPDAKATVLFEDRQLTVAEAGFEDRFAPLQTHVYEFPALEHAPNDVTQVEIAIRERTGDARTEKTYDTTRIAAGSNLLANPDIEAGMTNWSLRHFGKSKAEATVDRVTVHSGHKSLHLRKTNTDSASHLVSRPVLLEPNTAYVFGGSVKCVIHEGFTGPYLFARFLTPEGEYLHDKEIIQLEGRGVANPSGEIDWTPVSRVLSTGDEPVKAQIYGSLYHGIGDVWFDDLYIVRQGAAIEMARDVNLLRNGSFESQANPGWPDGWIPRTHWWTTEHRIKMLGQDGCAWTTDDAVSVHGQHSFRMTASERYPATSAISHKVPVQPENGPFTLSVYARADTDTVKLQLQVMNHHYRSGTLPHIVAVPAHPGREWKRYVWTLTLDPRQTLVSPYLYVSGKGTVWLDACQFEQGEAASPFDSKAALPARDTVVLDTRYRGH